MKNCKFMSPLDWSHHLTQMASLHKYEPSKMGKRVEALLEKLYLPENSYCYAKFPQWFADAASRGSEEEQVRYVMNHLCPNLFHFYMVPTPSEYRLGSDVVNTMLRNHMCENTQATILNEDGSIYQDGVHDTHEEFQLLEAFFERNYTDMDVRCARVSAASSDAEIKACYLHAMHKRFCSSDIAAQKMWCENQCNKTYLLNTIHGLA